MSRIDASGNIVDHNYGQHPSRMPQQPSRVHFQVPVEMKNSTILEEGIESDGSDANDSSRNKDDSITDEIIELAINAIANTTTPEKRKKKKLKLLNAIASSKDFFMKKPSKLIKEYTFKFNEEEIESWELQLKKEETRREILTRHEMPVFRILLFWNGTVLSALSRDLLFYFIIAIYILFRFIARKGDANILNKASLEEVNLDVIGGFLTFFLIFYVNEVYRRFMEAYISVVTIQGAIFNISTLANSYLPKTNAIRLVRFLNAMNIAGFVGVSNPYSFDQYFAEANRMYRVLTEEETGRFKLINMETGGSAYRELLTWCCSEVCTAEKNGLISQFVAEQIRQNLFTMRGNIANLYIPEDQPIPFFYLHFLWMLSVMYLPLFSIKMAADAGSGDDLNWFNDVVFGLVVILQASFVIGLILLGRRLSNPFGSEVECLSVMTFIHEAWEGSNRILSAVTPGEIQTEIEEKLLKERQCIGKAWKNRISKIRMRFSTKSGESPKRNRFSLSVKRFSLFKSPEGDD